MLLSIKTKLKLNKRQKVLMAKHAGLARYTFNWGLAAWDDLYKAGLKPNKYLLKKFFNNHVKPECVWIKEKGVCQKVTQYAFDNLGHAFDRYFQKLGEYPKFKKKFKDDSFTIDAGGKPLAVGGTSVKLPTIGWVKTYEGLPHVTTSKLTISRTADDWFIAFASLQEHIPEPKKYEVVGCDVGVKTLLTLSTGVTIPNPKHYRKELAKLKLLSKQLARKKKGSKNRFKARMKLAKHHARIANLRKDTLHKVTNYLCKNHAMIVIEDLNVKGMMANHKLASAIADCGFHEFKRQLTYKSEKFGNQLIRSDRWFASSKTCSNCGCKKEKLTLSDRIFECFDCNFSLDRDLNAAINLSRLAKA
ncbi:transposase [Aphanothece hegewaldii CCALA 016]|uniref:Transposase n=1 Tax=Aphanothece hegewaldii CCALA 016 TaxID=2107694 RepID=A0A2T1LX15_9CHRO|nr:RNA-guided endonuclease TnpB family protein [Aphanothece hegewaldii]PSF36666.1 transposase [Aphanothece hegewaldii CCALA 016]